MKRLWWLSFSALLFTACPTIGIVCQVGTTRCGNGCADFTTDSLNCGTCGQACFSGQVCVNSACVCRAGTTLCDGQCVVLSSDPKNCGTCGHACAAMQVCENKTCAGDCTDTSRCGNSCIDPMTDPMNCGGCGKVCADSQSCHAGACQWDLVAACYTTGQVVGLQSGSEQRGPLEPLGSNPAALAQYGNVLLAADGTDNRLNQAKLPSLERLSEFNNLGAGPNQVVVDSPYVYSVNSIGHTVQVLKPVGDAGCPAVTQPDAGCAWQAFEDGGAVRPLMADAGCFYPQTWAADAGCAGTLQADGGLSPLTLADAGCFTPPPPPPAPPMPCFQNASDAGLKMVTIAELDTGANTYPEALVKSGSALWVPLYGGLGAGFPSGQKVLKIDVTDPSMPHTVATLDLSGIDLKPFDGGTPVARPISVVSLAGRVWVALNNLDAVTYAPAGPGLLLSIDPTTLDAGTIELGSSGCLNPVGLATDQGRLFVSCAGAAQYDINYALISTSQYGVVMLDPATGRRASWSPACPAGADSGCLPILPSRLAVRDNRVYLGDQNGGRIFVADVLADGGLAERRGYATGAMGGPVQACTIDPMLGFSNVADILALP